MFFFAGADIHLCNCSGSAFQAAMVGTSLSAGRDLRLWRLLPFRQKWAGELKTSTVMDISVFEGVFGLKSRIFIRNYKLPISNYECDHLHFSICDYLREPIYFFSRRSTLIFFSLIHADLFSAPICDFNLRISAWTVFSEFSHPRPNIPQNYSLLKIRGVPPKAGRCYEWIDNWEFKKEVGKSEVKKIS